MSDIGSVALPGSRIIPSSAGGAGTSHVPNDVWENLVLTYTPWAKWPLNEAAGSMSCADHSGNGRTLSPVASQVQLGVTGLIKTSGDTSSYSVWTSASNVSNFPSAATWTWSSATVSAEFWINALSGHSPNELDLGCMGHISSTNSRLFRFYLNSSGNPIMEYRSAGPVLNTQTFSAGVYDNNVHQLVFVLDGANLTLYLDGVQQDQHAQAAAMNAPITENVFLGQPLGGAGSRFYTGYMGPVAWYTQALSAADVALLWAAATTT
jgi:hypothetical protein